MENRTQLLANLFDKKTIEVLKKLLLKDGTFYLRDISRATNVSLSTTFRIVQKLMGMGLVEKDQIEKFTIYKTNDKEGKIFVVSNHVVQADVDEILGTIVNITGKKPPTMLVTPEFFENMQVMGLVNHDKLVKL